MLKKIEGQSYYILKKLGENDRCLKTDKKFFSFLVLGRN